MTHHVLMCEPLHYRVAYEINPWMRRANAVDTKLANAQWGALRSTLEGLGVRVELVGQHPSVPDMTFTANAGVVAGRRFIPANFRFPERQSEAERFTAWFRERGYTIETIHAPHYWEGEGDVLPLDGAVYAGYRFRTEFDALDHLDELLGTPTVRLELVDPRFYHLDTCFCPLGGGAALYFPDAFSEAARALLAERIPSLVAVPEPEALRFACNAVVVDRNVVLATGCPATEAALAGRGYRSLAIATDEFIKAGGSVKCLVLTFDLFGFAVRA